MKKYRFILTIFILYIILNMVIFPKVYIDATLDGISAWAFSVLPCLLPFVFFTKVLSFLGTMEGLTKGFSRPVYKCFKTPAVSSYVFFMSIISGYPVGAKMTADLYNAGKITRSEAFRMSAFCSTSGPMFIIGAVGSVMMGSPSYGYIMFLAHVLGAFFNGFLYRNLNTSELPVEKEDNKAKQDLSSIVLDSVLSIVSVGAIIAIFFVVITSLSPLLSLLPAPLSTFLAGLVEITRGCIDLSATLNARWAIVLATFVISFGGLSTCLQSLTMLDKIKMPVWLFVLQKLTHAILATIIAILLVLILKI